MLNFYKRLKQFIRDESVKITLSGNAANIRLLESSYLNNYKLRSKTNILDG
ncbi:MAG: DUF1883 domain-containing protein [Fluviicola sp.]|nr:DUF1883 domain-containing protein [Fluviicola sp.]